MEAAPDLADLLRRVAAQDRAAFAALYRATSAKLFAVVSRILPGGDASEVLQEAYVKVWQRATDFDAAKGSPLAWMTTIARNREAPRMAGKGPTFKRASARPAAPQTKQDLRWLQRCGALRRVAR